MDDKPRTQGQATGKNSLFNTFISASDFNLPPQLSGQNTNKNSFAGDFHPSGKGLKFDYYKSIPVIPEQRLNHDNPEIHQSQVEFNSETMIIHDHRENDDYVKRMCIILAENLESTFPPGEHKEVSSNTINNTLEKSDKIQVKSKRPSLEHSKIFELLKSQERKDFSLNSTANLKISSPETKANLNISPDSIKKEFQIGSSHKKKKVSETVKPSNFRVEKNIITLLEEIEKDYDSKKSSPFKENMYAKNPMKASLDLENIHADFNGLALTSNQKLQRKPLQDISNKAVEFATAESQRDLPSSGTRFNNIITSEDSERNIQAQMTDNSDKDKENCAPDFSKITFRKPPTDYNMRLQLDAEVDLYCTEDINKETPRYNNEIDFKTNYYSPNYTDRLHTVEEVCSSSKESSTGGDYPIRSFNRSTSKREPMTSSVRAFTDVKSYFPYNVLATYCQ